MNNWKYGHIFSHFIPVHLKHSWKKKKKTVSLLMRVRVWMAVLVGARASIPWTGVRGNWGRASRRRALAESTPLRLSAAIALPAAVQRGPTPPHTTPGFWRFHRRSRSRPRCEDMTEDMVSKGFLVFAQKNCFHLKTCLLISRLINSEYLNGLKSGWKKKKCKFFREKNASSQ